MVTLYNVTFNRYEIEEWTPGASPFHSVRVRQPYNNVRACSIKSSLLAKVKVSQLISARNICILKQRKVFHRTDVRVQLLFFSEFFEAKRIFVAVNRAHSYRLMKYLSCYVGVHSLY